MINKHPGKIITFYSYKGGTGRTMALANTACLLARKYNNQDKQVPSRVLAIDWDFEAPGLHRFFIPYISEISKNNLPITPGWLDLFLELNNQKSKFDPTDSIGNQKKTNEILQSMNFEQYLLETTIPGLSFVKAGRFDTEYPKKASTFPWGTFFTETIGLFTGLVDFLRDQFDYVLVDSRTGITDTSGICTMLLPDKLIVVFTPNNQNLDGLRELVRKAVAYRKNSEDWRPLTVFPLPSRIEMTSPKLLEFWRFGEFDSERESTSRLESPVPFQPLFENLFRELYGDDNYNLTEYFNEVLLQHVAEYAYGEPIAVEIEKSESRILLKRSYEAFVERLVELDAPWQSLKETQAEREIVRLCRESKETLEKKQIEKAVRQALNLVEQSIPNTQIESVFEILLSIAETSFRSNPENAMAILEGAISLAKQGKERDPVTFIQQIETAISLTLLDQRNLLKAKELRNEVLTLAKSTFGENHPATLTSMSNLATILEAQEDLVGARALQEKVCALRKNLLGENHPETLTSMNNLATILQAQGDFAGARALQEQTLALHKRILGEEHPATLTSMNNLAQIQKAQGDLAGSRTLQEYTLGLAKRFLQEGHPNLIHFMSNLALIEKDQGDLAAARTLLDQAFIIAKRTLGEKHPTTMGLINNMNEILKTLVDKEGL